MPNVVISLFKNSLQLSYLSSQGLQGVKADFSENDVESFIKAFNGALGELNLAKKSTALIFLSNPSENIFEFVTVDKSESADVEEVVIAKIKPLLSKGTTVDSLYFYITKIAPFTYQFLGIKKDYLDSYLDISNILEMPLKAVLPWVLLLPRSLPSNDPAVFLVNNGVDKSAVFCDLNGVYKVTQIEKSLTEHTLEKVVHDFSVYRKDKSLSKVYTVGDVPLKLPHVEVVNYTDEQKIETLDSFEVHAVVHRALKEQPGLLETNLNALGLLPLPAATRVSTALVSVGAVLSAILAGILVLGYQNSDVFRVDSPVLSETTTTSPSAPEPSEPQQPVEVEFERGNLLVRLENGAGIAGIAARNREMISALGYKVESIGNATPADRTNTLVRIKASKESLVPKIREDLAPLYELVTAVDLPEDVPYDILIILGKN